MESLDTNAMEELRTRFAERKATLGDRFQPLSYILKELVQTEIRSLSIQELLALLGYLGVNAISLIPQATNPLLHETYLNALVIEEVERVCREEDIDFAVTYDNN